MSILACQFRRSSGTADNATFRIKKKMLTCWM